MNSNYQKLLSAFFLSSVGDWLYKLAVPIFLYQATGSAMDMAITYGLTFLPFVLVTPFGGVIADRLSRQQMLVRGDTCSFILTLLLAVLIVFHIYHLWMLYALVFCIASINALYHPIFQSIIPELVEKDYFAKANSYISSAENIILLLGPILSGILIALLGPTLAIFINALSFLISALLLKTIKTAVSDLKKKGITIRSVLHDLKVGFEYSYKHPIIKFGCLLFVLGNFGNQIILANLVFHLENDLLISSEKIGLVYAIFGSGAVLGSLLAPYFRKRLPAGKLILTCCLIQGLAMFLLLLFRNWVAVGAILGIGAGCGSIVIVTYFTLRQTVIPTQYLGRVIAITRLISYCAIPLASIIGGYLLKNNYSFAHLIWIAGIVMTCNAFVGYFSPLAKPVTEESIMPVKMVSE
jgi:MFS family permease